MKSFHRIIISLFFICIFIMFAGSYALCAEIIDKIVAVVNDDVITQSEIEQSMLAFVADYQVRYGPGLDEDKIDEAKKDALNRLIEEKLILQEAKRREVVIDESRIEERLQAVKSKFASEDEFQATLSKTKLTAEKLNAKFRDQVMMQSFVNQIVSHNVQINPTQIAGYYYGNKEEFTQPEKVKFSVILLKFRSDQQKAIVRNFAEDILKKIYGGEDFKVMAVQYSEGPNAENGGEMDFVSRGNMIKEIDDALFSLDEGEVSDIIETTIGCNIVMIDQRIAEYKLSLTEAQPRIRERLFEREAELIFREFIDDLKNEAYIDIK